MIAAIVVVVVKNLTFCMVVCVVRLLLLLVARGSVVGLRPATSHFQVRGQALFRSHVTGIRTGMREPFTTVGTFKRFFAAVDSNVFL